jgi:hypothetical protein
VSDKVTKSSIDEFKPPLWRRESLRLEARPARSPDWLQGQKRGLLLDRSP